MDRAGDRRVSFFSSVNSDVVCSDVVSGVLRSGLGSGVSMSSDVGSGVDSYVMGLDTGSILGSYVVGSDMGAYIGSGVDSGEGSSVVGSDRVLQCAWTWMWLVWTWDPASGSTWARMW